MNLPDAGQTLRIPKDVYGASVAAAGQDHEPLASDVYNNALVVPNPGVRLPPNVCPSLLQGESFLEIRGALDLPGHQHRSVEKQGWTSLLHYLPTLTQQ